MDEFISREATIKRIKEVYCIGCNSYNGVRCRACGTGGVCASKGAIHRGGVQGRP